MVWVMEGKGRVKVRKGRIRFMKGKGYGRVK